LLPRVSRVDEAQDVAHVGYWERDLDTGVFVWSDEAAHVLGLT